jgi:hypothetical protein
VHPASAARAGTTTSVNVPNGTQTIVPFGNVFFDLGNEFNTGTGTFTPKVAGTYELTCYAQWNAGATVGLWSVNVADSKGILVTFDVAANATAGSTQATGVVQLTAGDAVNCRAFQTTGVSQSLAYSSFSAVRVY